MTYSVHTMPCCPFQSLCMENSIRKKRQVNQLDVDAAKSRRCTINALLIDFAMRPVFPRIYVHHVVVEDVSCIPNSIQRKNNIKCKETNL